MVTEANIHDVDPTCVEWLGHCIFMVDPEK